MELKILHNTIDADATLLGITANRERELLKICADRLNASLKDRVRPFLVVIYDIALHCVSVEEYTLCIMFTMREAIRIGAIGNIDLRGIYN